MMRGAGSESQQRRAYDTNFTPSSHIFQVWLTFPTPAKSSTLARLGLRCRDERGASGPRTVEPRLHFAGDPARITASIDRDYGFRVWHTISAVSLRWLYDLWQSELKYVKLLEQVAYQYANEEAAYEEAVGQQSLASPAVLRYSGDSLHSSFGSNDDVLYGVDCAGSPPI